MPDCEYEFLDSGDGRRLERFAGLVVERPAPAAVWSRSLPDELWKRADLQYDRDTGWQGTAPPDWRVSHGGVVMALRPAGGGQVGVFPEHIRVGYVVREAITAERDREGTGSLSLLNVFAHTGLVTQMAARLDDVTVTHVDASRASVRQARENAALSGLSDRPVRWIVDDAMAFLRRERRRERHYGVIVADPPAYGRSRTGGEWKFRRDLPAFLEAAAELLPDPPGRLFLTCHEEGLGPDEAVALVRSVLGGTARGERLSLVPREGHAGRPLPAGVLVSWHQG